MNKSRFVIFTFLTLISFFLCAQTQIGSDIDGENTARTLSQMNPLLLNT